MPELITIREQSQTEGKNGPYLKVIDQNDKALFVWDVQLFPLVKGKQKIYAEVDRTKQYPRITAVIPSEQVTLPNGAGPSVAAWSDEPKDQQIARAVALKAAVDQWCAYHGHAAVDHDTADVARWTLALANQYLDWLQGTPF